MGDAFRGPRKAGPVYATCRVQDYREARESVGGKQKVSPLGGPFKGMNRDYKDVRKQTKKHRFLTQLGLDTIKL